MTRVFLLIAGILQIPFICQKVSEINNHIKVQENVLWLIASVAVMVYAFYLFNNDKAKKNEDDTEYEATRRQKTEATPQIPFEIKLDRHNEDDWQIWISLIQLSVLNGLLIVAADKDIKKATQTMETFSVIFRKQHEKVWGTVYKKYPFLSDQRVRFNNSTGTFDHETLGTPQEKGGE